jgi:zinc/manganese transport system ATP-binding protein
VSAPPAQRLTLPTSPEATPAVALAGASVRVGGRTVLSDVSLRIRQGEFIAVLGPNGAGKSTLMKTILGLVAVTEGTVHVLGTGPRQARPEIGYLPQRPSFDRSTRVRGVDLVTLGLDGHRWGVPVSLTPTARRRRREQRERVAEVIDLVGATSYATRAIGELSGGEQQRLLIAAALVRRPRLLILDEPLDSLDLPNQAAVAGLVRGGGGVGPPRRRWPCCASPTTSTRCSHTWTASSTWAAGRRWRATSTT